MSRRKGSEKGLSLCQKADVNLRLFACKQEIWILIERYFNTGYAAMNHWKGIYLYAQVIDGSGSNPDTADTGIIPTLLIAIVK